MNNHLPEEMVSAIAQVCLQRYQSALLIEGKSALEAFEEIVRTVLETDRERRDDISFVGIAERSCSVTRK